MKLLLVGRTGSNTDLLIGELAKNGVYAVKIYDTADLPETVSGLTDKDITITDKNGYMLSKDFKTADIIPVSPQHIHDIAKLYPDNSFMVIYVESDLSESGMEMRKLHSGLSDEDFDAVNTAEAPVFAQFEDLLNTEDCIENYPENVFIMTSVNGSDPDKILNITTAIMNTFMYQRNLQVMIRDCVINQVLPVDENGMITLSYIVPGEDTPTDLPMTPDILACKLMSENCAEMLQFVCSQYLSHHKLEL